MALISEVLFDRLTAAGINVDGCDSTGRIDFKSSATKDEIDRGRAIAQQVLDQKDSIEAIIDGERQKIRAAQSSIASEDFAQLRDAIAALPNSATKQILIAMARILWRLAVAQGLSRQFEG